MKEVKCTWLLMKDEEEDDEGVDDDIEIDILNDKDDIEDYCDDYIAEEANWSNIFLHYRE
jgi:hypothetical protein